MKLLILDGDPAGMDMKLQAYLNRLTGMLNNERHSVTRLNLREMTVRSCSGCFNCWLRTPGQCSIKDDAEQICRAYINSDLVVMASPLIMGFISARLKGAMDRLVPLVLPYFKIVHGEFDHLGRYDRYPDLGLILTQREDTDDEDIEITTDLFQRFSRNVHGNLFFIATTEQPAEEILHAFDAV